MRIQLLQRSRRERERGRTEEGWIDKPGHMTGKTTHLTPADKARDSHDARIQRQRSAFLFLIQTREDTVSKRVCVCVCVCERERE